MTAGDEASARLTGGCMCGTVRFALSAAPRGAVICHCKRCQRRTGSAFPMSALAEPGSLEITHGREAVGTWRPPDDGWIKGFCTRCGSQLFTRNPEDPEVVGVRMGAFDDDPGVRPRAHQFVAYAPPWAPVPGDGLPRFPERMT